MKKLYRLPKPVNPLPKDRNGLTIDDYMKMYTKPDK